MEEKFIGVICGLKSEARCITQAVGTHRIRVGISGANAHRAEELVSQFCGQGASAIVSAGISGGLDPALKTGDLIFGSKVISATGEHFDCRTELIPPARRKSDDHARRDVVIFGSDEIISGTDEKAALFKEHGAGAVDMESHGAARAAARNNVPFLAIRTIVDSADRALPRAVLDAVRADGSADVAKVLTGCLRSPGQIVQILQLGGDSRRALDALGRGLGPFFSGLLVSLDL